MTWTGITREEFGLALFELVRCCAGIEQLRTNKNLPPARVRPGQLTAWEREEAALVGRVGKLFFQLSDDQQREILAHFPWVARC